MAKYMQYGSVVLGVIVTLSLVSTHPVQVGLLALCAGVYIMSPKVLK